MKITIYMPLDDEGTIVSRPVQADPLPDGLVRIAPQKYNVDDEHWRFPPGTVVRVEERDRDGLKYLIAVEAVDQQ